MDWLIEVFGVLESLGRSMEREESEAFPTDEGGPVVAALVGSPRKRINFSLVQST